MLVAPQVRDGRTSQRREAYLQRIPTRADHPAQRGKLLSSAEPAERRPLRSTFLRNFGPSPSPSVTAPRSRSSRNSSSSLDSPGDTPRKTMAALLASPPTALF